MRKENKHHGSKKEKERGDMNKEGCEEKKDC